MAKGKKKTDKKAAKKQAGKEESKNGVKAGGKKGKPQESAELKSLKGLVEGAKARLEEAETEAGELQKKGQAMIATAKESYRKALVPYRDACKKTGIECEFGGGRLTNVSERISFIVEKTDKGIKVVVKGRPDTEEVISLATLKQSINLAAYAYTDKHIGPKEKVGNKGGSLSNRLRSVLGNKGSKR